ncbi:Hypothetical protein PHPALM_15575 [Phytophthora palmivora]|uniref:Uncharacterized protein n=1 Tax=Phytophthora palmivora TaxID=4796 RepID=A0A2P4XRV3_9STRA|nr:Hypothetical protein PHPALM_15575 [Phytophthora palmivora]
MAFVCSAIYNDNSGAAFRKLMDRFLAYSDGKSGEFRKRNAVMRYYRKCHYLKRVQGNMIAKEPMCNKQDSRCFMDDIYYEAT